MKTIPLTIRLPSNNIEQLKAMAANAGQAPSAHAADLVIDGILGKTVEQVVQAALEKIELAQHDQGKTSELLGVLMEELLSLKVDITSIKLACNL
ncbi:MAG: hypothetical protein ACXWJK_15160 [Burkholderiaceae bacterium]